VEEKRRYVADPNARYDDLSIGTHIMRNMNRCILCRKCVRFISEIAGQTDLGTFRRGSKTEINVLPDIPLGNPYSGNVVEICPVGALTSKSFRYKTRVWQIKTTPSICPNCADGCNIKIWAKDERIYRFTSRRNDEVDEGFLCDKGRFGFEFVNISDRLRHPLIKKNGKLTETTWDEAIEFVASNLRKIKREAGPEALAGVGSPRLTNEEGYLFQKLFRSVIGTNNVDHRVNSKNLLPSPDLNSKIRVFGMTNSISQIENAKLLFVLGCDLEREHPIINLKVIKAKRKGSTLLIANPASTRLSRFAQNELLYNKGTEAELLKGVIREIIEGKLYDSTKAGFGAHVIEDIGRKVSPFEIHKVSQNTGISAEKVRALANDLNRKDSTIILCGTEIIDHPQNIEIIDLLFDLLRLIGQSNNNNSGINLLWENCNSQGALDCGVLPDRLPGYVSVSEKPGMNFNQMLETISQGKVKGMYIAGVDPLIEYPDRNFARSSIEKLNFLVVQDIFLNETAKLADAVLPGVSFAEKEGTFTNVERRVQRLKKAFDPLADSKADWQIFCILAKTMGQEFVYACPRQIFEELVSASPLYAKLNWESLGETGMRWEAE
jgi:predicted molibdopterin-dependent oxidoreductase YjgC